MTAPTPSDHATAAPPTPPRHVALVGPVLPFRGGISQYTTQLHRALATRCELHTVSYVRQYPAWLYPGKSDLEPGQETFREPGVAYMLDCLNPLSWARAVRHITANRCDLAIFDWWTLFWAPAIALMALALRRRGVCVAFICHNLFDHDSRGLKRRITQSLLSSANAYLVHSSSQAQTLRSIFPDRATSTHPLPIYDQCPEPTAHWPRRGRLELLFFGFIRPYKGLDVLVDALARLQDSEVYLTVVGEPWIPANELRSKIDARHASNVELHLEYVDEHAAANFFARADLVVLPYRSASGSAVAATAFRYGCPVLATRTGGFPDVIDEGKTGFLVAPGSAEELAACLQHLTREHLAALRGNVDAAKYRFSWQSLASAILALSNPVTSTQASSAADA